MVHYITVNGKKLPIKFSNRVLASYCREKKIPLADMDKLYVETDMESLYEIAPKAIDFAHKLEGLKPPEYSIDDIYDLADENPSLLMELYLTWVACLPKAVDENEREEGNEVEKKRKPATRSKANK